MFTVCFIVLFEWMASANWIECDSCALRVRFSWLFLHNFQMGDMFSTTIFLLRPIKIQSTRIIICAYFNSSLLLLFIQHTDEIGCAVLHYVRCKQKAHWLFLRMFYIIQSISVFHFTWDVWREATQYSSHMAS